MQPGTFVRSSSMALIWMSALGEQSRKYEFSLGAVHFLPWVKVLIFVFCMLSQYACCWVPYFQTPKSRCRATV